MRDLKQDKIKVSEYCKTIRKQSGLTSVQFAKSKGVSRAYISKIEGGGSDKPSITVLAKIVKTYGFSTDDLVRLDVDNICIEGVGQLRYGKNPYKDSRIRVKRLKSFDTDFLDPNGYKTEFIYTESSATNGCWCDIYGVGPNNEKFYGCIIDGFSSSVTVSSKKDKLRDSITSFPLSFLSNIEFHQEQRNHLFLLTDSESVFQLIRLFHDKHTFLCKDSNFKISAVCVKNNSMEVITVI